MSALQAVESSERFVGAVAARNLRLPSPVGSFVGKAENQAPLVALRRAINTRADTGTIVKQVHVAGRRSNPMGSFEDALRAADERSRRDQRGIAVVHASQGRYAIQDTRGVSQTFLTGAVFPARHDTTQHAGGVAVETAASWPETTVQVDRWDDVAEMSPSFAALVQDGTVLFPHSTRAGTDRTEIVLSRAFLHDT